MVQAKEQEGMQAEEDTLHYQQVKVVQLRQVGNENKH
jgi:hypothetical protein